MVVNVTRWRRLRVGDRVRIVSIPRGNAEPYRRTGDSFTLRVLRGWREAARRSI